MQTMRFIQIEFMDGGKENFAFPPQTESEAARRVRLDDFFKSNFLVIACENELLVYPLANIRSLRMSLSPEEMKTVYLPISAIRGAERR